MGAASGLNGRARGSAKLSVRPARPPRRAQHLRVRAMTADDVAQVAQLLQGRRVCVRQQLRQRIRTALAASPGLSVIAEEEGAIVGAALACFDGFHVHISNFAVHEDYEGRGVGRRLHQALVRRARQREAIGIVAGAWMTATGFYYALGFRTPGVVYLVDDV